MCARSSYLTRDAKTLNLLFRLTWIRDKFDKLEPLNSVVVAMGEKVS